MRARKRPQKSRRAVNDIDLAGDLLAWINRRLRRHGVHGAIVPAKALEHAYILVVLRLCEGNQSQAARLLGIGRTTMLRRVRHRRSPAHLGRVAARRGHRR